MDDGMDEEVRAAQMDEWIVWEVGERGARGHRDFYLFLLFFRTFVKGTHTLRCAHSATRISFVDSTPTEGRLRASPPLSFP